MILSSVLVPDLILYTLINVKVFGKLWSTVNRANAHGTFSVLFVCLLCSKGLMSGSLPQASAAFSASKAVADLASRRQGYEREMEDAELAFRQLEERTAGMSAGIQSYLVGT